MKILIGFLTAVALSAQVSAVVSDQGSDVIRQTTGYRPKAATLARVDVCNAGEGDAAVATSRINGAIILQQQYSIYDSDVVNAVLVQLQQRDVFTRAQKIIAAGANTTTLLTALFKTLAPQTVAILNAAPAIAQALLPAAGDPRDLAALGAKILPDNATLVLGKKGSGNDCRTTLVVVKAASIKIAEVQVQ